MRFWLKSSLFRLDLSTRSTTNRSTNVALVGDVATFLVRVDDGDDFGIDFEIGFDDSKTSSCGGDDRGFDFGFSPSFYEFKNFKILTFV